MSDMSTDDKENQTPQYRTREPLITSCLEDTSVLSDVSCSIHPVSPAPPLNSTTTALNRFLEKVNVNDSLERSRAASEISFDLGRESSPSKSSPTTTDPPSEGSSSGRTPKLRRNPFDVSGIDHFPEISPNFLSSANKDAPGDFKWSIDHISEMNPADIREEQPSYILEAQKKEYADEGHQETVRSYFENHVIAPSPCIRGQKTRNTESQTNISLPLDFDLEGLLGVSGTSPRGKTMSDNSFRRMLFESSAGANRSPRSELEDVKELSEPDYEELNHSPVIKSVDCSPLSSDLSPSFIICQDQDPLQQGGSAMSISLLSPINSKHVINALRTPGRVLSTPTGALFNTPGPAPRRGVVMSTPGMGTPGMGTPSSEEQCETPAPSSKRKLLTPDKQNQQNFKSSQFSSPFISPIPRSLSYIKRHPKCPKKSTRESPCKVDPQAQVDSSMPSPSPVTTPSTPSTPAGGTSGDPGKMPMESSRIESDVSSEADKTKMILGIQPLDISEIKPQDNSQKLRTNNYLDISGFGSTPNGAGKVSRVGCSCPSAPDCTCRQSKDSGFGTSSAMSAMGTTTGTLPPLSEMSNIIAAESRPNKRKKHACSPSHGGMRDESGFQPPPVKRVVIAAPDQTGRVTCRRKHKSLE